MIKKQIAKVITLAICFFVDLFRIYFFKMYKI
jgi:hypothetical protein